ncbi:MAG: hypothetical protein ACTS4V_01235 [Candidatus Hodgkinia cicadicola]
MTSEVTEERTAEGARSFSSPTGVFGQFGGQVVTSVERGEGEISFGVRRWLRGVAMLETRSLGESGGRNEFEGAEVKTFGSFITSAGVNERNLNFVGLEFWKRSELNCFELEFVLRSFVRPEAWAQAVPTEAKGGNVALPPPKGTFVRAINLTMAPEPYGNGGDATFIFINLIRLLTCGMHI